MSDGAIKQRLQLWLRSEQAFGLPQVTDIVTGVTVAAPTAPVLTPSAPRAQPPRPAPAAPVRPSPTAPQPRAAGTLPLLEEAFATPEYSPEDKARLLRELNENSVSNCLKCGLHATRTMTVFGEGNPDADLAFVGEGPGRDEDASGRPFVGRAGQKLDEMIRAMGLQREQVFICNVVKCRAYLLGPPAKDRPPTDEEIAACSPYLVRQLEIVRPKVIVTLGLPSTRHLLKSKDSMTRMRGKWHTWRGIKVMPTWHPAYVLRNYTAQTRAEVWDDLKKVMGELNIPTPKRSGKQE